MMNNELVNKMSKSAKKDVSVFHKFLLEYRKQKNTLFYFVEGEDYDYYNLRLKTNINHKNIINYSCEGKKNVIGVRNLIKEKLIIENNNSLKFFVDKDYGLDLIPNDIYVTDCYSIENFYVREDVIFNIIENILMVNKGSKNYKKCRKFYKTTYAEYSKFAKWMNTFFYTVREKEKIIGFKRSNFNQFKLTKFMESRNLVDFKMNIISFKELLDKYQIEFDIEEAAFKKNYILFDEDNHANYRGKFELQYLKWFLNSLRESISSGTNGFSKRRTCKYDFSTDCMLLLSSYAITPDTLIEYILKDEINITNTLELVI